MARLVTIYGGSGFVGRQIARVMAAEGWRVRVAVRRPYWTDPEQSSPARAAPDRTRHIAPHHHCRTPWPNRRRSTTTTTTN